MMKSDNTIESNESTEDRDRRNRELNEKKKFEMEINTGMSWLDARYEESRWDNLIFIDMQFYINDFLFREEFLWDKKSSSPSDIKEFCCYLLRENTMSKEKNYTGYCNGVNRFSFDFLECCAEYMTKKILEEVKFYDRFNPYDLFKSGVFGSGCGIENEHLININLDITDKSLTYKDSFQWDIINEENIPEDFAKTIVRELKLPQEFVNLIALNIRRQIKEHVFNTMNSLTEIFINLKGNIFDKTYPNVKDSVSITNLPLQDSLLKSKWQFEEKKANSLAVTRTLFATYNANNSSNQKIKLNKHGNELIKIDKIDNKLSQVVPFLFEYKLENQLGKKISRHCHNETKPNFLRNQIKKKEKRKRTSSLGMTCINNDHKHVFTKNYDSIQPNENVRVININTIHISKDILKYRDYFDIVSIDKNKIREYLSDLNI